MSPADKKTMDDVGRIFTRLSSAVESGRPITLPELGVPQEMADKIAETFDKIVVKSNLFQNLDFLAQLIRGHGIGAVLELLNDPLIRNDVFKAIFPDPREIERFQVTPSPSRPQQPPKALARDPANSRKSGADPLARIRHSPDDISKLADIIQFNPDLVKDLIVELERRKEAENQPNRPGTQRIEHVQRIPFVKSP